MTGAAAKVASGWWYLKGTLRAVRLLLQTQGAKHRIFLLAFLGIYTPIAFAEWSKQPTRLRLAFFVLGNLLLLLFGTAPSEYAVVEILETVQLAATKILTLGPNDRITVHRILRRGGHRYEQLTNYSPTRSGRGRRFPSTHGIVAQCFQTCTVHTWSVPASKSFREAMKERWFFSDDEISRLTQDRRSFLAFPIGQEGQYPKAVIYIDSPVSGKL